MSKKGVKVSPAVGERVAEWLQREYPRAAPKRLARDFGCSPNTAKKWLQGLRPSGAHFDAMVARWGGRFLAHCYEAAARPWREAAMDDELAALRARLDALDRARSERRQDAHP